MPANGVAGLRLADVAESRLGSRKTPGLRVVPGPRSLPRLLAKRRTIEGAPSLSAVAIGIAAGDLLLR